MHSTYSGSGAISRPTVTDNFYSASQLSGANSGNEGRSTPDPMDGPSTDNVDAAHPAMSPSAHIRSRLQSHEPSGGAAGEHHRKGGENRAIHRAVSDSFAFVACPQVGILGYMVKLSELFINLEFLTDVLVFPVVILVSSSIRTCYLDCGGPFSRLSYVDFLRKDRKYILFLWTRGVRTN